MWVTAAPGTVCSQTCCIKSCIFSVCDKVGTIWLTGAAACSQGLVHEAYANAGPLKTASHETSCREAVICVGGIQTDRQPVLITACKRPKLGVIVISAAQSKGCEYDAHSKCLISACAIRPVVSWLQTNRAIANVFVGFFAALDVFLEDKKVLPVLKGEAVQGRLQTEEFKAVSAGQEH